MKHCIIIHSVFGRSASLQTIIDQLPGWRVEYCGSESFPESFEANSFYIIQQEFNQMKKTMPTGIHIHIYGLIEALDIASNRIGLLRLKSIRDTPYHPMRVRCGDIETMEGGLTLRQHAAIELRVPNSGLAWLDTMIVESRRLDGVPL